MQEIKIFFNEPVEIEGHGSVDELVCWLKGGDASGTGIEVEENGAQYFIPMHMTKLVRYYREEDDE